MNYLKGLGIINLGGIKMRVEYFIQEMIDMVDTVQMELVALSRDLDK